MALYLIIILNLTSPASRGAPDKTILKLFLKKVEILMNTLYQEGSDIPNFYSEPPVLDNIPIVSGYFIDEETQLQYSLVEGKIYDPDLGIGMNIHEGTIYDPESGQWYPIDSLDLE